jgi:hypothetical protein
MRTRRTCSLPLHEAALLLGLAQATCVVPELRKGTDSDGSGGSNSGSGGVVDSSGGSSFAGAGTGGASGNEDAVCQGESFDHDADPETECKSWSDCDPGEFVTQQGSATQNRKCGACEGGTFTATQNQPMCQLWHACESGFTLSLAGTDKTDAQCAPCDPGTTSEGPNADECTDCADGTFAATAGEPACTAWHVCTWAPVDTQGTKVADTTCVADGGLRDLGVGALAAMAVDASDNVYVVNYSCLVTKLDNTGGIAWSHALDIVLDDEVEGDGCRDLAVDPDGNVYVAGNTTDDVGGTNAGGLDAIVRKYEPDGDVAWTSQFGTTGDEEDTLVEVDDFGNLLVALSTTGSLEGSNAGETDTVIRKYDGNGAILWTDQFGTEDYDYVSGVSAVADGEVFLATREQLRRYGGGGTLLADTEIGDIDADLAIFAGGMVSIPDGALSMAWLSDGDSAVIIRLADDGSLTWVSEEVGYSYECGSIAATDTGVFVLCTGNYGSGSPVLQKYGIDSGASLAEDDLDYVCEDEYARRVVADSSDRLYVTCGSRVVQLQN